jgi:hypothetical protein
MTNKIQKSGHSSFNLQADEINIQYYESRGPGFNIDYSYEHNRHLGKLIGRDSIIAQIENILYSENSKIQICLLLGEPGHGKSAIINELIKRSKLNGRTSFYHLSGSLNFNEEQVIRSLVYQASETSDLSEKLKMMNSGGLYGAISLLKACLDEIKEAYLFIDGIDEFINTSTSFLINFFRDSSIWPPRSKHLFTAI